MVLTRELKSVKEGWIEIKSEEKHRLKPDILEAREIQHREFGKENILVNDMEVF